MSVDLFWLAKPPVLAKCRWDEQHAEQIITGSAKRIAGHPDVVDHGQVSEIPTGLPGGIVCFPAGAHEPRNAHWLNKQINRLPWVILFLTSDECQEFPIDSILHRHMHLWVQLPRPEKHYPAGTTFIGEGAPDMKHDSRSDLGWDRPFDWALMAQSNHARREGLFAEMATWGDHGVRVETRQFLDGADRRHVYLSALAAAKVAPAPAGICSQSSFRAFEALESGCVPLLDDLRPDGRGEGYWAMLSPDLDQVANLWGFSTAQDATDSKADALLTWPHSAVATHSAWHATRRRYDTILTHQLDTRGAVDFTDTITVVIPTSLIPSHPDTSIIEATVASVREVTDAEILITCDGVRRQQRDRSKDYAEYERRLCLLAEQWGNVTPIVHLDHIHQAAMLKDLLQRVSSEYVMYVEHDTPIVNQPDIPAVLAAMRKHSLNVMRFYHEKVIHEDHQRLMRHWDGVPWVGTVQWSQRPHIARTDFYRRVMAEYFGSGANTFIEDVMFGGVEHDFLTRGIDDAWHKWRMAMWAPPELDHMNFSIHLDGRGDDPKFGMRFRYPKGVVPPGAPFRDVLAES